MGKITIWRGDNGKWGVTVSHKMPDGSMAFTVGQAIYDDAGDAAFAYGMSMVDGEITWDDNVLQ